MKVLLGTSWLNRFLDRLQEQFPDVEFLTGESDEEIAAVAPQAEVALGPVSRSVFVAATNLKWIQSFSAGVEWMAHIPELQESDVTVTNARGAHAVTIAEHTLGLLLFLTRRFGKLHDQQKAHEWKAGPTYGGDTIAGKTMGIIGLGQIGRAIAKRAAGLEMNVIAVDAHEVPQPDYVSQVKLLDGMNDLISQSDVVVVATPITKETRGMIGADELRLLKPSAYLLVISRGGIIDEPTLIEMLKNDQLAGAGLDVAATEPMPADDPLWDAPNLLITPHCSPTSTLTNQNVMNIIADNLKRYQAGEELHNLVDKKLGY